MSAQFRSLDAIRQCESEIWRALEATLRLTLTHWAGSELVRGAMERVVAVIEKQVQHTSAVRGESQWKQ